MTELWNKTLEKIQAEVPAHTFNTWLKPLRYQSHEDDSIRVEVPNGYYRDRLREDFLEMLRGHLRAIAGKSSMEIEFVLAPSSGDRLLLREITRVKKEVSQKELAIKVDGLASRYTFSSFVVGANNQFAHAAAQAVVRNPGQAYNPLFIHGGVGLGKTHLICAIGNEVATEHPGLRAVYRTAEQFMCELIDAIRKETTYQFRNRYRDSCDVLLIDDIQFLGGKERTQDEFFHTFNTLYESKKQIVLTSDLTPDQIVGLDDRLRSRFQWGLLADIGSPDIETRVAIVKKKAEQERLVLPDEVALFLATHFKANIRVLEGAMVRLAAYASISDRPITIEFAREVLLTLAPQERSITIDSIQKRVAEFYHINVSDLRSSRRHKVVTLPRQVAMYLGRKLTDASFPEIGRHFGGKDHTTVLHAAVKIEKMLNVDLPLRQSVAAIEQTLQSA